MPYGFVHSSTLMFIHQRGRLKGCTLVSILQHQSKEVFLLKSVQCSKNIGDGPIDVAFSKRK
jgi:hypothetical protein